MYWTREVGRFGRRISQVGKGVWRAIWRRRGERCDDGNGGGNEHDRAVVVRERQAELQDIRDVYARYLLGQATLSDDEDNEFRIEEVDESDSGSELNEDANEEGADVDGGEDADVSAPVLYADLARRSIAPRSRSPSPSAAASALTPML